MKGILVPCDFAKPAACAFRFTLGIGEFSKGIVYVIELPAMYNSVLSVMKAGKALIEVC